ncbi:hypothetical protein ILYODFUR_024372 [Ilyodon furcidens]|uniref:Uncharacterized protein n=1 Tax=Ilyodon furcidens TaxID=33524 RepID=A0ABV0T1G2_9TELE
MKEDVEADTVATLFRASDGKRSPKKRLLLLLLNGSRLRREERSERPAFSNRRGRGSVTLVSAEENKPVQTRGVTAIKLWIFSFLLFSVFL